MIDGPVANTLVLCVGLPLVEVAKLARAVGRGTVVMAAGDVDTARKLLGSTGQMHAAPSESQSDSQSEPQPPARWEQAPPRREVRGCEPAAAVPDLIQVGRLTIDPPMREVLSGDRPVRLSAREFDLLTLLASDLHRVWPFAALVQALWNTDYLGDHDQLASTVKRLRKRLGPDTGCVVQSVHGVGYRLLINDTSAGIAPAVA